MPTLAGSRAGGIAARGASPLGAHGRGAVREWPLAENRILRSDKLHHWSNRGIRFDVDGPRRLDVASAPLAVGHSRAETCEVAWIHRESEYALAEAADACLVGPDGCSAIPSRWAPPLRWRGCQGI
eukprot:scaffold1206_cov388-Prasinococcus_capsulatus_cf.AAC.47